MRPENHPASAGDDSEAPRIIRMGGPRPGQPEPVRVEVDVLRVGGTLVCNVRRDWARGATASCGLCDVCDAHNDVCTKLVNYLVKPEDAPLLDTRGFKGRAASPRPREDRPRADPHLPSGGA